MILFHSKLLGPYRKIEMLELQLFSFGVMQNFRPFSLPFRPTVEQNGKNELDLNLSKLSKTVRDLKIG